MRNFAAPIAVVSALLTSILLSQHELWAWLVAASATYAVLLLIWPHAWLAVIPALVPVLDLRPFVGWSFFSEFDIAVLVTIVMGYLRIALAPRTTDSPNRKSSHAALAACCFLLASCVASLAIGLYPIKPLDLNSFTNYYSSLNALRVIKGPLFAIVLFPLWLHASRTRSDHGNDLLVAGMLAGLCGACVSVVWERAAFPGLMDFATEYRVTGLFSGSHVGGASLDGYLLLALPFCVFRVLGHTRVGPLSFSLALLAASIYAILVTFTRTTYAAAAIVLVLMLVIALPRGTGGRPTNAARLTALSLLAMLVGCMLLVFSSSGYRGLAAALGTCCAAYFFADGRRCLPTAPKTFLAATCLGLLMLPALLLPKAVYGTYILLACAFAYTAMRERKTGGATSRLFCMFVALCCNSLAIAWYWNGVDALPAMALVVGLCLGLAWLNARRPGKLWRCSSTSLPAFAAVVIATGLVIPVLGNPYAAGRFATVGQDLSDRSRHWTSVLSMIEDDWVKRLFGMGSGRFPDAYFWRNAEGEFPGAYLFVQDGDNTFLRLTGPRYVVGYGDSLRFAQNIAPPQDATRLRFAARATTADASLEVAICEKHLIYAGQCVTRSVSIARGNGGWANFEVALDARAITETKTLVPRPFFLTIGTQSQGAKIDIDDIALVDGDGSEVLRNGSFSAGMRYWFFTSDRYHLAYHAKNLFLHALFEQGMVGLACILFALLPALARLGGRTNHGQLAQALAFALIGFAITGLFDSLIDDPQLALLFYLLMLICIASPRGAPASGEIAGSSTGRNAVRMTPGIASREAGGFGTRVVRFFLLGFGIPSALLVALSWFAYVLTERTPGEVLRHAEALVTDTPIVNRALAPLLPAAQARVERPVPPDSLPTLGKGAPDPEAVGISPTVNRATPQVSAARHMPMSPADQVVVRSTQELAREFNRARAGTSIVLTPGTFKLTETLQTMSEGSAAAPITVRALAPRSVIIESATVEAFKVVHPHWIFENLELVGTCARDHECEHAFHVAANGRNVMLRSNVLREFNAAVKVNGEQGAWPDSGVISYNTFANTRPRDTTRSVAMIDIVGASEWRVTDNHISGFVKAQGDKVSYGVFMKGAGRSGRIERNLVVCTPKSISQAGVRVGISFGGGSSDRAFCRDGSCAAEHVNGLAASNVIAHCNDFGIDVNNSTGISVIHNTLINTAGIDMRGARASASIQGNLLEGRIRHAAGAQASLIDNLVVPPSRYFANPDALDLRSVGAIPGVQVSSLVETDFCGDRRPPVSPAGASGMRSNCGPQKGPQGGR